MEETPQEKALLQWHPACKQKFQEVKPMMCNALMELMRDELEESQKTV